MERWLDWQQEEETGSGGRWGSYENGGGMLKILHKLGEPPYRGGGTSRAAPKIPWVKVQIRLTRTGNIFLRPHTIGPKDY